MASATDTSTRREAITACAQELVDSRGLDGFTMDDLAAAVGVSRRTLFNHVDGKIDAVLGGDSVIDDDVRREFVAGGPSGDLVTDLVTLAAHLLQSRAHDRDDVVRFRRILRAEPRLMAAVHDRFRVDAAGFADLIVERGRGTITELQARVAVHVGATIFDLAVDTYLTDPRDLDEIYAEAFVAARDFFHPTPDGI